MGGRNEGQFGDQLESILECLSDLRCVKMTETSSPKGVWGLQGDQFGVQFEVVSGRLWVSYNGPS